MPILEDIQIFVVKTFPRFGRNKSQEIVRLLYEISQREGTHPEQILAACDLKRPSFNNIKKYLISRRYPSLPGGPMVNFSLPGIDLKASHQAVIKDSFRFEPKDIYIEKSVWESELAIRIRQKLAHQDIHEIESHKDYLHPFKINTYNQRCDRLFIVKEDHDFYLPCPCSHKSVSCSYHILNLGIGCPFECVYCHLQAYINSPGIIIPANIEDYFIDFDDHPKHVRLGNGQFTDSLALDHLTQYSKHLVNFFRQHPDTLFEFKTKSSNINLTLKQKACKNVVIGWSMNPPEIIETMEFYTAPFNDRLQAAILCAEAGYKVSFHFDPVICVADWQNIYHKIIDKIFSSLPPSQIAWISLGGLRLSPHLKKIIENRFPDNPILHEELILGFDRKLRYAQAIRIDIYKKLYGWIRHHNKTTPVYLCMEAPEVYKACHISPYRY